MDKRYQVFVSSTYTDLVLERQTAMLRLLELDCMPTGMEFFPASDESAWNLIEGVIGASDYYVLIVGGRYGSTSSDSPLSFTEREYDLAVKLDIPILTFLHEKPGQIAAANTEQTDVGRAAFEQFRRKVQNGKHVKFWTTAQELGAEVMAAVIRAKKVRPRTGWVPADQAADPNTLKDLERVRREADALRARLADVDSSPPAEVESLEFGESLVAITGDCEAWASPLPAPDDRTGEEIRERANFHLVVTWNDAFRMLGANVLVPASEDRLRDVLIDHCARMLRHGEKFNGRSPSDLTLSAQDFDRIKIQFLALGLWEVSTPRDEPDAPVWRLTAYGRKVLTGLVAVRKSNS